MRGGGIKLLQLNLRESASFIGGSIKNIREFGAELGAGPRVAKSGNALILFEIIGPDVVDSVDVVGMRMRVEEGINSWNFATEGLLPKVGRSVYDDALPLPLNPDRGSKTLILGVGRGANRTSASDHGDASRSSAPEHSDEKFLGDQLDGLICVAPSK